MLLAITRQGWRSEGNGLCLHILPQKFDESSFISRCHTGKAGIQVALSYRQLAGMTIKYVANF